MHALCMLPAKSTAVAAASSVQPTLGQTWSNLLFDLNYIRYRMLSADLNSMQATTMDFYNMDDAERSRWLDDGLHFTEFGYDVLGRAIARAIERNLVE
jgi:lysophospholipase L1-like esterase